MLIAAPSLRFSSGLSTFRSADVLSGDGDLKAKLCDGECCRLLPDGLIVDAGVCCIIEMVDGAEETAIADEVRCDGWGML